MTSIRGLIHPSLNPLLEVCEPCFKNHGVSSHLWPEPPETLLKRVEVVAQSIMQGLYDEIEASSFVINPLIKKGIEFLRCVVSHVTFFLSSSELMGKSLNILSEDQVLLMWQMTHCQWNDNQEQGGGSFGKIYLMTKTKAPPAQYIQKEARPGVKCAEFLRRECLMLFGLSHPHVVRALVKSSPYFLILEYCSNGDLDQFTRKTGPLSDGRILQFLREIVAGVSYLHGCRIIHRDLKNNNVFVTAEERLKIGDLGLAQQASETEKEQGFITRCFEGGGYSFVAPENFTITNGVEKPYPVFFTGDIWSIGIMVLLLKQGPNLLDCFLDKIGRIGPTFLRLHELYNEHADVLPAVVTEVIQEVCAQSTKHRDDIEQLAQLLERMLVFDPRKRIKAAELEILLENSK